MTAGRRGPVTEPQGYGSHPEYLPPFMTDRRGEAARHVLLLDHADNRQLAAGSLNRFPARSSCEIDWGDVPGVEQHWCPDSDAWVRLAAELCAPWAAGDALVVVFWGNLVIPTVVLPAQVLLSHAREIDDAQPHFWLHPLGGDTLVECLPDGTVTSAVIPAVQGLSSGSGGGPDEPHGIHRGLRAFESGQQPVLERGERREGQ